MALGADDYITKPFSTQEVVDRVRELLAEAG
jgi:DNA-binding response OmpR family regulator